MYFFLSNVEHGEHALAERTCQKWFARFKSGDFGLEDEEHPGRPKKFEDEELEALLGEYCCQTQEELAESLRVTQAAIKKRLKAAGSVCPDLTRERYAHNVNSNTYVRMVFSP